MIRRLVDTSWASGSDQPPSERRIEFWLAESRTPEFLIHAVWRFPDEASRSHAAAVRAAIDGGDIDAGRPGAETGNRFRS